jgi:predicted transcriptional regulator
MGRPQGRNTEATSFSLNKQVLARLNAYSAQSMVAKTKIVEKSITEYLDRQNFTMENLNEEVH